jgi:hypothetical protein
VHGVFLAQKVRLLDMKKFVVMSVMLMLTGVLRSQPLTTPVNVTPDCLIFFDFTDNGSQPTSPFDNRFIGCKTFYVTYQSTGFPAITLTFQQAPDNNGVPGAFVAFTGTIVEGVNPNVAITGANTIMYATATTADSWLRITLSGAVAGAGRRLRGTFYGYRQVPVATVLVGALGTVTANQGTPAVQANRWPVFLSDGVNAVGTVGNPLRIDPTGGTAQPVSTSTTPGDARANSGSLIAGGAQPLLIFPYHWNGASWDRKAVCNNHAVVSLTGAGDTEIVALSGATQIRVCHLSISFASTVDLKLTQGTGANCAVGTADVTGVYQDILTVALDFDSPLLIGASQALCVNLGAGVTGGGSITYAQY